MYHTMFFFHFGSYCSEAVKRYQVHVRTRWSTKTSDVLTVVLLHLSERITNHDLRVVLTIKNNQRT